MNKAERESQFRAYFETCTSNPENLEMVGMGNPYAKILIVGQESAEMAIRRNIEDVSACLNKGDFHHLYYQHRFYDNRIGKNGKRILNRTWNAYQKLIDYVRPEEKRCKDPERTDFCMDAFTTELNNTVSPSQAKDWKPRIETFKGSDFIKGFPVVVLACCRYINEDQIRDTFNVTKDPSSGGHTNQYSRSMWFDSYHSSDGNRLVIHTRQLSQYSDELLRGMADVIKGHFRKREEEYRAEWYD